MHQKYALEKFCILLYKGTSGRSVTALYIFFCPIFSCLTCRFIILFTSFILLFMEVILASRYSSLSFPFPCFILQLIHFQIYGKFVIGDLFSVTALTFDLDVFVFQECNRLTQINNEVKLSHFTLLEYKHFFKRDTFLPIFVVVICIVTDVLVPDLHFTILKLNELSTHLALLLEPYLLVVAQFFSMR